jgi:hypothetical protein
MYPSPKPPSLLKQGRGLKVGREIKRHCLRKEAVLLFYNNPVNFP